MTVHDDLAAHLDAEAHKRQLDFAKRRKAYTGDLPKPLTGDTAALDNTLVPAPTSIVDDGAAFLFGAEPSFDVTEAYGKEAQKALTRHWRRNLVPTMLLELAKFGGYAGTAGFKFEPDTDDQRDGAHEWVVFDPSYLDVVWDPHNVRKVLRYRFEYPTTRLEGSEIKVFVARQDITAVQGPPNAYGRTKTVSWNIENAEAEAPKEYVHGGQWMGFQATRQLTTWRSTGSYNWPFVWAPVFVWQNLINPGEWWGRADIDDAILALTNQLNRVVSNLSKTVRHHGHPIELLVGAEMQDDRSIGEPLEFADADPDQVHFELIEMQGALESSLEFLRELKSDLFEHAKRPEVARGKIDKLGNLSGTAIRLLFGSMLAQNAEKQLTYGDGIEAALRRLLEYMGYAPTEGADGDVKLIWGDPLPKNEKEDAETGDIDRRNGLSKRTYLERRGMDADVEFENALSEGANDPGMRGMLDLLDGGEDASERVEDAPTSTDASVTGDE